MLHILPHFVVIGENILMAFYMTRRANVEQEKYANASIMTNAAFVMAIALPAAARSH